MKIEFGDKENGHIPYESMPAVYYLFRQLGYQVQLDTENRKININAPLAGKKIVISHDQNLYLHSYRKGHLERNILEQTRKFLENTGADLIYVEETEIAERADFQFRLGLFEIPGLKEPILELTNKSNFTNKTLLELFQMECSRTGTKFKFNELGLNENSNVMKVHIKYPLIPDNSFWRNMGGDYAVIISIGILARIQESWPFSAFSLFPSQVLSTMFFTEVDNGQNIIPAREKGDGFKEKNKLVPKRTIENNRKEVQVIFDYHLLIEESDSQKIKILGDLHIKNIGTENLQNPAICLRSTPAKSIKLTGQILPPNVADTMGVMNNEGTKGWRYMNENWLEEAEEKGELWIVPIQPINLKPKQTESLSNFQINIVEPGEHSNIRVEAFVYFNEQNLEASSSNQISLLFSKPGKITLTQKKER